MCAPASSVAIPVEIDGGSTDEELMLFLGGRRVGDPTPSNVITEINPFSIDPRNSPEGIWFLYTSKDSCSCNEGRVIKVTNGYWTYMDHIILRSTATVGRKTTLEFYVGQAPFGDRTGWRMQEYCAEQMAAQVNNDKSHGNSILCRFFLQIDERSGSKEQCDPASSDDAYGEHLESVLLSLLEQEERNFPPRDAAKVSQKVAGGDEVRQLESSSRPPGDAPSDKSMEDMHAGYDFSKEDYIELKDLYDPVSSSSSSDNSSIMSMDSDECFDAEAMLRDIETEGDLNMEEHIDYRFNVATSVRSNQVVIRPPSPALRDNNNLVVRGNWSDNSIPAPSVALAPSSVEPQSDSDASTSGSSRGSHGSASSSGISQGSGTSKRSGSKSVRSIAKLGKIYCCFRSF